MFHAHTRPRRLNLESLEPRQLLAADPIITEFLASNRNGLSDGDGRTSDWIELYNRGNEAVDLAGYSLTDSADDPTRWTFPSRVLQPGEYLVVFASGRATPEPTDAAGNLHTNFRLSAKGEYLALIAPDGKVLTEFSTQAGGYPAQEANVSYGFSQATVGVDAESASTFLVPMDDGLGTSWTAIDFDPASNGFNTGTAALGYEARPTNRTNFADLIETELPDRTHAFYSRFEFDVDDASQVGQLTLKLSYDNGVIVYLNGSEVMRENAPANPNWISTAPNADRRDADALEPVEFDLSEHIDKLVNGKNVLAIHALNNLSDNTDLLLVPQLIFDRPLRGADTPVWLISTVCRAHTEPLLHEKSGDT